jgi:hypothetical protein
MQYSKKSVVINDLSFEQLEELSDEQAALIAGGGCDDELINKFNKGPILTLKILFSRTGYF